MSAWHGLLPPPRMLCIVVCLSVSLSVCLLATFRKNFWTDLYEIFREIWQCASEELIKSWWRSGSRIRIRIATLVRRALAEVWTVPVLVVYNSIEEYSEVKTVDYAVHLSAISFL